MKVGERFNPSEFDHGTWIPDWIMGRSELELTTKVVYSRLRRHAHKKGHGWPHQKTLAESIGVSEKTVERSVRVLEGLKLLDVERAKDRRGACQNGQEHAHTETGGNRYFFLGHPWMPECSGGDYVGNTGTDLKSVGDRLKVCRVTDLKSVPSLRESGEESQGRESLLPVASLSAGSLRAGRSPERLSLSLLPTSGTNLGEGPPPAEGCEKLNPPPVAFDADAHAEEVAEKVRQEKRARLGALISDVARGTEEERAKKLSKRHKPKPWQPPPGEMDDLPPELAAKSPKGRLMRVWVSELSKTFPESPVSTHWGQREYGQTKLLLDRYEADRVEDVFRYVIANWIKIKERMFKGQGSPVPSIGVVLSLHASLVPEAAVWAKHREVLDEYAQFGSEYQERPHDLMARYLEAQKDLKSLGL
jgi:hypothetical protein